MPSSARRRASMSQDVHDPASRAEDRDRVSLFCGSDLAARIERAEAQVIAEATAAARRAWPMPRPRAATSP